LQSLNAPGAIILVAVDDSDDPVGFLMAGTASPPPIMAARVRGEVSDMFVAAEWRGRGVGKRLLRGALAAMKACGAGYVSLMVASANREAIGFYEAMGLRDTVHQMFMRL
jgi:ribosomal protein S18 acetylase RimI-like enzyme